MSKQCIQFIVRGRVQGVFFRAFTQKKAQELGLTGWAKNHEDGSVWVLACGEATQLAVFEQHLLRGPQLAQVFGIDKTEVLLQYFEDFTVLRD